MKSSKMIDNRTSNKTKGGFYALPNDPQKQVWSISGNSKTKIDYSNVMKVFSKLIKSVTQRELEKIPIKDSVSKKYMTVRKRLSGKFIQDPNIPINYWYIDTKNFERHLLNQFELIDLLYCISSRITEEELDNIPDK